MFEKDTGLFAKAQQSKYLVNWILAFVISFAILFLGQILSVPFMILGSILFGFSYTLQFVIALIIAFPASLLFLFLWVKFVEKRNFSSIGFTKSRVIPKFVKGILIGFLLFSIVVLILWGLGMITLSNDNVNPIGWSTFVSILLILPAWILQSSTEEAVSRGWMMNVIGARYTPLVGLILSSSTFGLLHLFNASISVLAIINIVLVGLFLGLFVIKEGDLWAVCGIHAAWNWAQGNIYGFEVSGNDIAIGSLYKFNDIGPSWITGGDFGPEAGIVSTLVLGVASIVIFILMKRQSKNLSN